MTTHARILRDGTHLEDVTPEIVAELFAGMASNEQARFFNKVAEVATTWDSPWCMQLQYITDDDGLTLGGRRVMQEIGEYSHWGLLQQDIKRIVGKEG